MTKQNFFILACVAALTLSGVQSSHSFRLEDLIQPPPQKKQPAPEKKAGRAGTEAKEQRAGRWVDRPGRIAGHLR